MKNKITPHQTNHTDHEKKAACPNRSYQAALSNQHVKKKQQRGQQQKAHELFHMQHPRTWLWQKSQPGRLSTQKQVRGTHSSGNRNEHRQDNRRRLRKRKAERGAEKRGSAGRRENGGKDTLERRTQIVLALGG